MNPEREPGERDVVVAGFKAIREIDRSDCRRDDALVAAFLCAAWPSEQAQNQ
jgi:hypothetical protein